MLRRMVLRPAVGALRLVGARTACAAAVGTTIGRGTFVQPIQPHIPWTTTHMQRRAYGTPGDDSSESPALPPQSRNSNEVERTSTNSSTASLFKHDNVFTTIFKEVESTYKNVVRPLDSTNAFTPKVITNNPMVMALGNHSSGKSTFINKLLSKEEQNTGVAPTDDSFTVIIRGEVDRDLDGVAATSDPALGFQELRKLFGPMFLKHFKVKIRVFDDSCQLPPGLALIDTPGMIDSPVETGARRTSIEGQNRGYDFLGVTKWFAERCDLVLLMFDPSNPGTSGETLDVLSTSLAQLRQNKYVILFNKVDSFIMMSDFARAYGALCWNLAKVLPHKDLPYIENTFSEVRQVNKNVALPLEEFQKARERIFDMVQTTPKNKIHNLITELHETTERVQMMARVSQAVGKHMYTQKWLALGADISATLLAAPLWFVLLSPLGPQGIVGSLAASLATIAVTHWSMQRSTEYKRKQMCNEDGLDKVFATIYFRDKDNKDVLQRWSLVRDFMVKELESPSGVPGHEHSALPYATRQQLDELQKVLDEDVPRLHRQASTAM